MNTLFYKVTSEEDVMKALKTVENKAKKLDILVSCSGIFVPNMIFNPETQTPSPLSEFEHIFKVSPYLESVQP